MISIESMKQTKKEPRSTLVIVSCIVTASLFFVACEKDDGYGGEVVVPLLNRVEGLHPLIDRNVDAVALQLLYNGLVEIDENLEPSPDLAESWTISDDGLSWEFSLRRDVKFHDGEPLTAADVVFTFERILNDDGNYAVTPLFGYIASVHALDDYTVRVVLLQPSAPLLHRLTIDILPSHILDGADVSDEEFRRAPIGTGPFALDSWDEDAITFSANEEYFEGRPYLDTVVLKYVPDKTRAWSELMQGEVSIVTDLDSNDFDVIGKDDRFATYSYLDYFYHTVLLNHYDPLLSNRSIRAAIKAAINVQDIIEKVLNGWAVPTTGPFIPGPWYNDDASLSDAYDPERAVELLETEGWTDSDGDSVLDKDGEDLSITLLVDEGDVLKESLAQNLKWQLFLVGVRVNVEFLDRRVLLQEKIFPGNYQTALLQFNAAGDPDSYTSTFWHSGRIGSSNVARYSNPEVDRLIEAGRSAYDLEERRSIYRDIHRIMAEDTTAVFLFVRRIYIGATSRIEGIEAQPQRLFRSMRDWKIKAQ